MTNLGTYLLWLIRFNHSKVSLPSSHPPAFSPSTAHQEAYAQCDFKLWSRSGLPYLRVRFFLTSITMNVTLSCQIFRFPRYELDLCLWHLTSASCKSQDSFPMPHTLHVFMYSPYFLINPLSFLLSCLVSVLLHLLLTVHILLRRLLPSLCRSLVVTRLFFPGHTDFWSPALALSPLFAFVIYLFPFFLMAGLAADTRVGPCTLYPPS